MTRVSRIRCGEDGQAIVMVLALVVIVLGFGIAVLGGALSAGQLSTHDARVRRAQQAAEAGVQSQLYQQSENNLGSSYNLTGGILGLGNFLDCLPLKLNVNLQITGVASAYASTAGICPPAINSSTGSAVSPYYTPLDNHTYVESEYISNTKTASTGGLSTIEFPEIVSIGCDSATGSNCGTSNSSPVYARELALLAPTGPVQAVEGMGNVTIQGLTVLGLNAAGVVNGDIMAGGSLTLPALSIAANTTWPTAGNPLFPTFGYGTSVSASLTTAKLVQLTGGFCTAGSPSAACQIKRPAPIPSTTTCALCSTGITCSSCTGGYNSSTDTFNLTAGTATFAAGDYVFCNFNAANGTKINTSATSTTPVRIFILAPNQPPCSANGYTQDPTTHVWSGGNFNATEGVNDLLTGTVDGVTNTLDPSGLQIYAEGDGSYDNDTTVTVGQPASCVGLLCISLANLSPQAMIIYAPTSSVTVNTGSCTLGLLGACVTAAATTFAGSVVGDNVYVRATAITQDLDLGNYPIYSGANSYRVSEEVQCDGSLTKLGGASVSADTSGC